jgi:hypothetical protein
VTASREKAVEAIAEILADDGVPAAVSVDPVKLAAVVVDKVIEVVKIVALPDPQAEGTVGVAGPGDTIVRGDEPKETNG